MFRISQILGYSLHFGLQAKHFVPYCYLILGSSLLNNAGSLSRVTYKFWAAGFLYALVVTSQSTGRPGHGFIGYGIEMYRPACAYGCHDSISAPLNCTDAEMGDDGDMGGMRRLRKRMGDMGGDSMDDDLPSGDGWMVMDPTPACMANNDFYLQTLAYCLKERCLDVPVSELEEYWALNVAGRKTDQPAPKESYQEALAAITTTPSRELNNSMVLNYTAVVSDEQYIPNYYADLNFEGSEQTHERYGLVIFLTGAFIPIGLSLLRLLPWPVSWVSLFDAYFIDPPVFGSRHASPLWGLGIVPTRGQALFIGYLWLVNIVLSAVGYNPIWPHAWYTSLNKEVTNYVSNRLGLLSFANLPLVVLYAGRNNVLLLLTNWSHTTFLLLHRWIAFICMLQAVLHSAIYLQVYTHFTGYDYESDSQLPYWYWGIIGTLALAILIPASIQPLRQRFYQIFHAIHIAFSILALIGCYLHIYYRFNRQWGYETWVYIAVGVWVFDRLVRIARTVRGGIKRAYVTPIDDEYFRVDIPGITATGHVYLHFPTISTWRIWENHPFSVAGITRGIQAEIQHEVPTAVEGKEPEASETSRSISPPSPPAQLVSGFQDRIGTTFFIRKSQTGLTSRLMASGSHQAVVPVLLEASYPSSSVLKDHHIAPTSSIPHVLLIAGGVGITAILPYVDDISSVLPVIGSRKLYWGVRTLPLVDAVENMLGQMNEGSKGGRRWGRVEVTLSVADRFNLQSLLESELCGKQGGTTVVVCGPPEMADEVRCIVSGLSRHGVVTRLIVESFSW
ncbi:ferric-chelate reductase [Hypoxylon crocopeplum]|nr:ferric-chelate reductase [Hypoxylon crocopeplum]